jgi:hypothetical protein
MKRLLLAAVALTAVGGAANAQVGGFSDVPANHWAAQSVARLAALGIINGFPADPQAKPAPVKKSGFDGAKPVTRYELAVTLYRFVQYLERTDKQKKNSQGAQAKPTTPEQTARWLVSQGYLPAGSPLLKEGGKVVTAKELSEALAQVITESRTRTVPVSPDSRFGEPIEHPDFRSGG